MDNLSEILANPAVIWFLVGLGFLILEFVVPGLIILFFGVGCWFVSLWILIAPDFSFSYQLLIFLITSILSLVLFRKSLKKWLYDKQNDADGDFDGYIGKHCVADSDFLSGIGGKVSFNGSLWNAHSDKEVKKGDTLIVKAVEGISLIVEPI